MNKINLSSPQKLSKRSSFSSAHFINGKMTPAREFNKGLLVSDNSTDSPQLQPRSSVINYKQLNIWTYKTVKNADLKKWSRNQGSEGCK